MSWPQPPQPPRPGDLHPPLPGDEAGAEEAGHQQPRRQPLPGAQPCAGVSLNTGVNILHCKEINK